MNTPFNTASNLCDQNLLDAIADSSAAISQVLSTAASEQLANQTEAGATLLAVSLESIVPAFAPAGTGYVFDQIPKICQSQGACIARSMVKSIEIASDAQRRLMELWGSALSRLYENSGELWFQTIGNAKTVANDPANRRVSTSVINFPDRRAQIQADRNSAQIKEDHAQNNTNRHARRHAI